MCCGLLEQRLLFAVVLTSKYLYQETDRYWSWLIDVEESSDMDSEFGDASVNLKNIIETLKYNNAHSTIVYTSILNMSHIIANIVTLMI